MKILQKLVMLILGFILFSSPLIGQIKTDQNLVKVKTIVTDYDYNIRKGEQIHFVDTKSGQLYKGISDQNGQFDILLPYGSSYSIKIKSIGEAHDYNEIVIEPYVKENAYTHIELTILFEQPRYFTLDNVYFESGKSILSRDSYIELNELVEYMRLKEDLIIKIGGHTDDVGDDDANLKLSQDRADAVRRYLIAKRISPARVIAMGYGEGQPIDSNTTKEGRQNNRRTEVIIISE